MHPLAHKSDCSCACVSIPGAQGGEAERAQRRRDLRGLLPRRRHHRVGLQRPDDQSLGCRYVGTDTLQPLAKPDSSCACGSIPGAQGGEAERAQQLRDVRGLLPRRQDHRVGLRGPDDQSLECMVVKSGGKEGLM